MTFFKLKRTREYGEATLKDDIWRVTEDVKVETNCVQKDFFASILDGTIPPRSLQRMHSIRLCIIVYCRSRTTGYRDLIINSTIQWPLDFVLNPFLEFV